LNCTLLACNELCYSGHLLSFILVIEPTKCSNFHNFILEWNSTSFGQFLCPSPGVFHCTHSNGKCHTRLETSLDQDQEETSKLLLLLLLLQLLILILREICLQTCMTYTIAVCTVKNSRLCTEEMSKTCTLSFQSKIVKISASSWFYYKDLPRSMVTWM